MSWCGGGAYKLHAGDIIGTVKPDTRGQYGEPLSIVISYLSSVGTTIGL